MSRFNLVPSFPWYGVDLVQGLRREPRPLSFSQTPPPETPTS